jgi:hypothetical protein
MPTALGRRLLFANKKALNPLMLYGFSASSRFSIATKQD